MTSQHTDDGGGGGGDHNDDAGNHAVHSCTIFLCSLDWMVKYMIHTEIQI